MMIPAHYLVLLMTLMEMEMVKVDGWKGRRAEM